MSHSIPQSDAPTDVGATPVARARSRRRSKQRRRLGNVAALLAGLVLTGALYSVFSPAQAAPARLTRLLADLLMRLRRRFGG